MRAPGLVEANVLFFDSVAATYEDWAGGLHRRVAQRLVDLVSARAGERVLDVGCGTGLVTHPIADAVGEPGPVIGIDVSEAMLVRARQGARANTSFVLQSADHHMPFRDRSFDLVTFGDSLAYLASPSRALREAARLTRPGGRIGLALRIRSLATAAQQEFFHILEELNESHPLVIPRPGPELVDMGEKPVIAHMLNEAGFEQVQTTTMATGERMASARTWVDLMSGLGPRPHALVTTLGPQMRRQLEAWVEREMGKLGEDAFHYHEAFTFALARRSDDPN